MKLHFDNTGYLEDFRATECVPDNWTRDAIDWLIEFVAYDCSACQTGWEREIYERGHDFECLVRVVHDPIDSGTILEEHELARFTVAYKEEAERLLQECADIIYG